jgi:hypothetical protein
MVIALIALAAFVVLLSLQVYFAQNKIQELNKKHELLKRQFDIEHAFNKVHFSAVECRIEMLESEDK